MKLDKSDYIILRQLQLDASSSILALCEACNLSTASVQRRLARLRKANIIEAEVAVLNPQALGQGMTFVVMVELERERIEQLNAFQKLVSKEPHVQQCYYVTGEADFVLICIAPNMTEFEALTHRLFFENQNVRRFRTSVVMSRTKVGMEVPLPV